MVHDVLIGATEWRAIAVNFNHTRAPADLWNWYIFFFFRVLLGDSRKVWQPQFDIAYSVYVY